MKTCVIFLVMAVAVGGLAAGGCERSESVDADFVYQIETGGRVGGYAVVDTTLVVEEGRRLIRLEQRVVYLAKLLGMDVDSESRLHYVMEADGKRLLHHEGSARSQTQDASWSVDLEDGRATFFSTLRGDTLTLDLPTDTVVENSLFFEHIVADFAGTGLQEKTYRVLEMADFRLQDARVARHGREALELDGRVHDTIVVDKSIAALGTLARMWIDTETAMVVKVLEQDGNVVSLADPAVIERIERVDLDEYILDETNVAIADVTGLVYMKVRAVIRPTGLVPTVAGLNVPGQSFTGTVEDGVIDGVFEIEHPRYDGAGAPAFPPPAETYAGLEEYLAADGIFETDDEVLAAEAQRITAGSADSWEAATRLARWVSDEINYAIPGGGTARNTYDLRAGECGAHSILLATFCRAVGIPARMVWGCMYTPERGGVFGQHGWTEIHMGPAGWIPVDATAGETDYVDSGHIRVAHFGSMVSRLNAQEFEILEYRVAGVDSGAGTADGFVRLVGEYEHAESPETWETKVMDGSLVVQSPEGTMLALQGPDEKGRWVCRMAPQIWVEFAYDGTGRAVAFTLYETISLPRRSLPEVTRSDVPADLAPHLGSYHMARISADFEVLWEGDGLALKHPHHDRSFPLERVAGERAWQARNAPYRVSFAGAGDGPAGGLELEVTNEFRRK